MKFIKSPNFNIREKKVKFIVLHYTEVNLKDTLKIFQDPKTKLSSHYVIDKTGDIFQMVDLNNVAYHAGESFWRGAKNLNEESIGIEIVNNGKEKFSFYQINKLIEILDKVRAEFEIDDINIVGHSDIAPLRKIDPGILFPWKYLAKKNHGIYINNILEGNIKNNKKSLINNLAEIGYSREYIKKNEVRVIEAFNEHFNGLRPFGFEQIVANKLLKVIKKLNKIFVFYMSFEIAFFKGQYFFLAFFK